MAESFKSVLLISGKQRKPYEDAKIVECRVIKDGSLKGSIHNQENCENIKTAQRVSGRIRELHESLWNFNEVPRNERKFLEKKNCGGMIKIL